MARLSCFFGVFSAPAAQRCAHVRAIDIEDTPVDAAIIVKCDMQMIQNLIDQAFTRPSPKQDDRAT